MKTKKWEGRSPRKPMVRARVRVENIYIGALL
jgi:hypothetical protein